MTLIRWDGGAAGRCKLAEIDRQRRIQEKNRLAEIDRQRRIQQSLERNRQERKREQELALQEPDTQDTLTIMLELSKQNENDGKGQTGVTKTKWVDLKPPPQQPIDLD